MRTIVLFCLMFTYSHCALVSESNGTAEENIDGLKLVELGRKTHKPLLTILGIAIRNLHPCEVWSPWTRCEAVAKGYFGIRTRSRACIGRHSTKSNTPYTETDTTLCEGHCPMGSNLTRNGFCLKLHTTKLVHDDAEKHCEQEGSYLINIDSEAKYQDVKNMLSTFPKFVQIGGRRATPSSPWVFRYGSQIAFIKWGSGDPDNGATDLCLTYNASENLWYDTSCTSSRPFICEFPIA